MKKSEDVVYESIAVLAVHMPDAEEIPFEENHEFIMEQYRRFLNECMKAMQRNNCRNIILYNNRIYGVYDCIQDKAGRELETIGIRISRQAQNFNSNVEGYYAEKLLCGIGIAAGQAARILVNTPFLQNEMWMGHVFDKAYSMARMSVCDGRRRVFIDDSIEDNMCR